MIAREKEFAEIQKQHEREWAEMKDALDRDADLARNASEAVAAKKIGLQQKANELMLEEKKLEGIREKMKAEALTQLQVGPFSRMLS